MKLNLPAFIMFVGIFLVLSPAAALCNQRCGTLELPFPFGFSAGCQIQLNCSSKGTILAADFPVQSITRDTILINLPVTCGRPVEALGHLFNRHYAPTSLNAILLQNCSARPTNCFIPTTMVKANFELLDCSERNDSFSCYSETDNGKPFIDYKNLMSSGCRSLISAVSRESFANSSVSLDFQIVRIEWWLLGECRCSNNARCIRVSPPIDGNPQAYRCECVEGFAGDGFRDGLGCPQDSRNSSAPVGIIVGVMLGITGIVSIIMCCFFKRRCSRSGTNQDMEKVLLQHGFLALKRYKYSEIKKLTKSFSDKLGEGGYGSVYKGMLPDGCLVAVKVLSDTNSNGEDFINEVASINRTSHVNIVNLLGFCYDRNKRALVYELMPNKSLDKFISNSGADRRLDLEKLYKVAFGVAKGLEYLHTGCNTRIVHFDIKPQNILLDEDFCPKISDFGLAKLCKKKQSILSLLGARGTVGYIAPEIFSRNYGGVSHKSDVYSYGMMILEMAGARKIEETEAIKSSENYFPDKIYEQVVQNVTEKLDDFMVEEEEERKRKMLLVGFWCIQTTPSDRPPISKVVEMLEGSIQSIQIPPKPTLFCPNTLSALEISSSLSAFIESSAECIVEA